MPPVSEMGMEKPADDVLEQDRDVVETDDPGDRIGTRRVEVPLDVNEADAAEQDRIVETDDDDYYR